MGIYQMCFDLIHQYIYGGVALTSEMTLVNVLFSTIMSFSVVCLPIIIVYWVAKFILRGFY